MVRTVGRGWIVLLVAAGCGEDAGVIPDAAMVDAGVDPRLRRGDVTLISHRDNGMNQTLTVASFGLVGTTVVSRDDGPCRINRTTKGTYELVNAGTVRVAGAATGDVVLEPGAGNMYRVDLANGFIYSPNELLTLSGTGATVPAFSATVVHPSALTVTSPTALSAINKSAGITATWTATTDEVGITINQYPDSIHSVGIHCSYPGAAGTGTVPPSALAELGAGRASFLVSSMAEASAMAGEYEIHIATSVFGFNSSVTVQ